MPEILRSLLGIFLVLRYRTVIVALLAVGLPVYLYLAFGAKEPVFSPEKDVALGRMSALEISEDPEQFPLLSEDEFPEAYAHLRRITGAITASPEIEHRDLFAYDQVKIVNDDDAQRLLHPRGLYLCV